MLGGTILSFYLTKRIQLILTGIILLINLGTFFYVEPLSQNLSDLGNSLGHRWYLILWGTSTALYLLIYTLAFIKKSKYSHRIGLYLLIVSCCMMMLSVCIPYLPEAFPVLSKWHTRIAIAGTVLYVLIFFHMITECLKTNVSLFQKYFYPYCFLVVFDTLLYLLNGGVSTLLETTFSIGMCSYLYVILQDRENIQQLDSLDETNTSIHNDLIK